MKKTTNISKQILRDMMKTTRTDARFIRRMRKLGMSTYEIAKALNISEQAPALQE